MVNLKCTVFSEIFDLPNFDILFWLIDFPKISIFSCFCWYTNSVCIAKKNIYFFDFLYILWSFDAHGYPKGSWIVFIILLGQLKSAWYDVVEKKKNPLELRINDLFNKLPFWTNIPEKILEKTCIVNIASPPILHESKEFAKQNLRPKVTKFKIDVSYPIP